MKPKLNRSKFCQKCLKVYRDYEAAIKRQYLARNKNKIARNALERIKEYEEKKAKNDVAKRSA